MGWEHGAWTEVEQSNCQTMAADSWECCAICVGDAPRFEGEFWVLVVVVEPVAVIWEQKSCDIQPCVGILFLCDKIRVCILVDGCNANGAKQQHCKADQDAEHFETILLTYLEESKAFRKQPKALRACGVGLPAFCKEVEVYKMIECIVES